MTDFNQAIILGNVTKDPEIRYTSTGQSVTSFSVATNRRWTNHEGQPQEEVEFHNIVAWGKLAEICGQILYKGRKVLISGRIRTRSWEGQDGARRQTTEIIADNICATGAPRASGEGAFVNSGKAKESAPSSVKPVDNEKKDAAAKADEKKKGKEPDSNDEEINLDDIPF